MVAGLNNGRPWWVFSLHEGLERHYMLQTGWISHASISYKRAMGQLGTRGAQINSHSMFWYEMLLETCRLFKSNHQKITSHELQRLALAVV